MEKKVVYIAGPVTGVKEYWKPFEEVEDKLTAEGYIVLTPTRLPWNLSNDKAMKICFSMIDQADAVYFLPGWKRSTGANLEMDYCNYTGKPRASNLAELAEIWKEKVTMKKWIVTYTFDTDRYEAEYVEGNTYVEAYVNLMLKHPMAIITDIKEA